ncbi:hypothetical protein HGRIS_010288 [Hohenbuehelia grisea]|uniref:L-tryptophan decarboxylase PsiD-like domain-containing protein n=1 Tax=Hohenbuehelia grisea TaxID=104357 RepID=A0ABR3J3V9_9AGAR
MPDGREPLLILRPGAWSPAHLSTSGSWLASQIANAGNFAFVSAFWHPVIKKFQRLIEETPEFYIGFHDMFSEIPVGHDHDPAGQPQVKDYMTMLNIFNKLIAEPPEWPSEPSDTSMIGFPFDSILNWPSCTRAGFNMLTNPIVNAQLKKVLDAWGDYLRTPASRSVIPFAINSWPTSTRDFIDTYVCDPEDPTGFFGFMSWDDFFVRRFRKGKRAIPQTLLENDAVVHSACEASVYRIAHNVKARDSFWLKTQDSSLYHMLNNDTLAAEFVGGTVFQAYLSASKYHRWHSPVNGVVVKTVVVPGTYFAGSPAASFDSTNGVGDASVPMESQGFITAVAARALVFINASDPRIGLMCFMAVGMVEVSTCEVTVKPGDILTKGQEIGMFHYGGSTYCLLFRHATGIQFSDRCALRANECNPELLLNEPLAWVGTKPDSIS